MPNYDFHSLSSYDFELLVRDLLQEELATRLESFTPGRDRGIDFRFQTSKGNLVVQCKHYADYDVLYRVLKRDEVRKVRRLKPARYILALSTPLTPDRKESLLELLKPYCLGTTDIYGREDLNNLLGRHDEVERAHVKLWLTSEPVLRHFLQSGIWGDAELALQRIRQRTRRYVPNSSLPRAREILDNHHYCIIAGIPGIGKTTLAEILLIEYVDRHGFQAIRIANDLAEIKSVKSPKQRQVFYFDDFLGKTTLDKLQKNEDQRLMELIEEVAENKNWRFILTTREYILNAARLRYEALACPTVEIAPCIIDLSDYTYPIRARILYNHIFFSDISDEHKRALLERRRYLPILRHQNYNPRIIEHMTLKHNVAHIPPAQFFDNFVRNLENPTRVWDHAFRNQLNEAAQHLLLCLVSMPGEVLLPDLETAFNAFYQYRRTKLGFSTTSRDFEHALKELDGNFIKTELVGKDRIVAFHNPSVGDFMEGYLADSPNDVIDLVESATFFDQLTNLWDGRGEEKFSGIAEHGDRFLRALSRQFSAPTCRIVRTYTQGEIVGMYHHPSSTEERIASGLEITDALKDVPDASTLADQLLVRLADNIEMKCANKDDLVDLLVSMRSRRNKAIKPTLAAAGPYLTGERSEFDDFSTISKFVEKFPDAILASELDVIRTEFLGICEDYIGGWDDNPKVLRSIAEDITAVASKLSVKVDYLCDGLLQRADELERESPEHEPEYSPEDWRDRDSDNVDTETMFDNLLHELNEARN
ncbi:MAG: restriction endonuclease [Candidatus Acidiferrales bacterium]